MPRPVPAAAVALVALLALAAATLRPGASAQDPAPDPAAAHPFVGAWIVDTDVAVDGNFPALAVATSDGTYLESHPEVGVGVGTWAATGERAADLTIVFRAPGETGSPVGLVTARVAVEVAEAGDGWEAPYAFEAVAPDGAVLFAGEGRARAVRVGAEPAAGTATPVAAPAP